MASTTYADVPGAGINPLDVVFRVKVGVSTASEDIAIFQVVAFHTTAGQVTKTTVANTAMAGFSQDKFESAQFDVAHVAHVTVRIAGTTRYIAGADCSGAIGGYLVLEGTDGRLTPCAAVANTHYVLLAVSLDDPDADGNLGTAIIMYNVPYFVSAS